MSQLCHKANKAEIVTSKTVFDNGIHHSIDKETSIKEVASTIRSDISLPETSWPPKIDEMEKIDMPDSLRHFLTKLLSSELHSSVGNENINRQINSFGADLINGVMKGTFLTKKHYLLT